MKSSPGTNKTIHYCKTGRWRNNGYNKKTNSMIYKPHIVITDFINITKSANDIKQFILKNKATIINIAGHRDTYINGFPYALVLKDILYSALTC